MIAKRFHIEKILVPYDFSGSSESALEHAIVMARNFRAEIYLLHVVESFSFTSLISQAFSKSQSEFESKVEEKAEEKLKEIASATTAKLGRIVHALMEKGKIFKTIIDVADNLNVDIIVTGAHGASGVQEKLIGSNAAKVVMNANCPVLTVHSGTSHTNFKNILLPIDNSSVSRQKVRHAAEIARSYRSTVHVVGAIDTSDNDLKRKFDLKVYKVGEFLDEHEVANTVKSVKGDQLAQIALDNAQLTNADLIVIMTEQEGSSLFLGNAAQHVINHANVPVLTVRPDKGDPDKISVGY